MKIQELVDYIFSKYDNKSYYSEEYKQQIKQELSIEIEKILGKK